MATKIQLRRDTLSNWTKADPVIMEGEIALVSENADNPVYDRFKIGNGVNKFSELPYAMRQQIEIVQRKGASTEKVMSQKAVTDLLNAGYLFLGIADTDTIPYSSVEVLQNNLFYIAIEKGTYLRFGNKEKKSAASLMILKSSDSGRTWTAEESADLSADISDLLKRMSVGKAPVWITMTLEREPHDPTRDNIGDIIFFEEGNYLKEVVRSAQGGNTLGQAVDMETGRLYVYGGNLCKWEDGDFVPFYLDDINTLKSKARYEYSLSKILALTDTSGESAIKEAFTPTYAPEGSLSPRVPKAGDLLIDENNTVVVSEGTQIFFSFTYQEEIISMRVYSGGSSFRFNVWKFPAGTVYDFNSIDTLTESSTADDIKKALTPKIGDGMRIPNSGDIMEIGIEENPDTVIVLYRYRNTFAYYHNRLLTTIGVEGEDDSPRVVKTISRNYVYDFDKINALTNASTFSDIMHAFSPLIIGTEGHIPKTGDLLTSGYDEEGNAVRSAKVICHNGNSFAYCYGGKHVTVELVGKLGNPDMRVEKTVTDLAGTGYEPKKYDYDKVMGLTTGSTAEDIAAAFTPIGGGAMEWPLPGDLLVSADDRNYSMFLTSTQTTKSNAPIYLQILKMTNAGAVIHVIGIRGGTAVASAYDIELDKEVESGGALRITTSKISVLVSGGNGSYDLGVTFQQLQDAIASNQLIMGDINGELYAAEGGSSTVNLMSVAYLQGDFRSVLITIPKYSGTTATVTVTTKLLTKFVQIPYSFLSGEIGGTYESVKMPDLLAANIIQTDKGIATLDTTSGYVLSLLVDGKDYVRCTIDFSDNGGLKLTARTETPIGENIIYLNFDHLVYENGSKNIGVTIDELLAAVQDKKAIAIAPKTKNGYYNILSVYSDSDTVYLIYSAQDYVDGNGRISDGIYRLSIKRDSSNPESVILNTLDFDVLVSNLTIDSDILEGNIGEEFDLGVSFMILIYRLIGGVLITKSDGSSFTQLSASYSNNIITLKELKENEIVIYELEATSNFDKCILKSRTSIKIPKTSYNKIAHLVFDLEVIGENDVTLTLDKLNSYWLESIGSSDNLNLRYEGSGAHGMPMLDIVYSKINTDVNNDEALWQKAFTDNNIVFTNCDIPSDQKIITTVDLSVGKVATLTIDFSNVTAMTPFKEDNSKIFVEIYEPVK